MNWLRIRELVRKEFILLLRDSQNRRVLFIAPIIMLMIFGYVVNYDIKDIRIAILDKARTRESRMIVESFRANKIFRVTHVAQDERDIEQHLMRRDIDLGIEIGPDVSSQIKKGESAKIQILADGSMSNMASIRIAYSMIVLNQLNRRLMKELYPMHMDYGKIDARIRTWYNPNLDSQFFFVPGIVAFVVMLIALLLTSIAVIKEKEAGTMEQLIVTPLRPIEMIIGKTIPYIIISVCQMVVVTMIAVFWFKIPLSGSVLLLLLATLVFLLSTLGVGLLISTVSSTQQQAMMTTFFFMLPFFMLSGFIFPIANMPVFVQWLTYLNPLRYFLTIIRGIFLKGVGMEVLWPEYLALAILGLVVFAGAISRFKKRLD